MSAEQFKISKLLSIRMIMNYKVSIAFISIVLLACTPKQANFLSVDAPLPEATAMASISEQPQLSTPPLESTGGNQTDDKGMAPQDPLQGQPIPMDPRVRMGKLANGMHYYIQQNQKPENRAELRLAVAAGSINEDDDQLGLAHFVEHMAFNGTKKIKKKVN